jgi:hypothetical protein
VRIFHRRAQCGKIPKSADALRAFADAVMHARVARPGTGPMAA